MLLIPLCHLNQHFTTFTVDTINLYNGDILLSIYESFVFSYVRLECCIIRLVVHLRQNRKNIYAPEPRMKWELLVLIFDMLRGFLWLFLICGAIFLFCRITFFSLSDINFLTLPTLKLINCYLS